MLGRRRFVIMASLLVLACAATGCEWPVRPSFQVTSTGTSADVAPGDGVCETAAGNGVCTLAAAVDEANALGVDTDIVVPTGDYSSVPVVVTGQVRINEGLPNRIAVGAIDVHAGGQLIIDGVANWAFTGAAQVDGVLVMRHSQLSYPGTQLRVGASGVAGLENVTVAVAFGPAIQNDGFLALRNVTVMNAGSNGGGGIDTGPTGTTKLESTAIGWTLSFPYNTDPPTSPACTGTAPISLGANVAWDGSCGLTGPGDHQGANPALTYDLAIGTPSIETFTPNAGSMLVDAIPLGSHGCGDGLVDDQVGHPRPVEADGDPDTPAACDIGAIERQVP